MPYTGDTLASLAVARYERVVLASDKWYEYSMQQDRIGTQAFVMFCILHEPKARLELGNQLTLLMGKELERMWEGKLPIGVEGNLAKLKEELLRSSKNSTAKNMSVALTFPYLLRRHGDSPNKDATESAHYAHSSRQGSGEGCEDGKRALVNVGNGLIVPGGEPAYTTRTEQAALKTATSLRNGEVDSRFEQVEGRVTKLEKQVKEHSRSATGSALHRAASTAQDQRVGGPPPALQPVPAVDPDGLAATLQRMQNQIVGLDRRSKDAGVERSSTDALVRLAIDSAKQPRQAVESLVLEHKKIAPILPRLGALAGSASTQAAQALAKAHEVAQRVTAIESSDQEQVQVLEHRLLALKASRMCAEHLAARDARRQEQEHQRQMERQRQEAEDELHRLMLDHESSMEMAARAAQTQEIEHHGRME